MVALPATTWERLVIWLALGLIVYFAYGRRNAERTRAGLATDAKDEIDGPRALGVVNS
jgi:APA family basic amino acid/polyamine antiporter